MIKLRALKVFNFAGRQMRPGEEFEAGPRDARLLTMLRRAALAPAAPAAETRAEPVESEELSLQAEQEPAVEANLADLLGEPETVQEPEKAPAMPEPEPVAESEQPRKKRKYFRRDMTSEG